MRPTPAFRTTLPRRRPTAGCEPGRGPARVVVPRLLRAPIEADWWEPLAGRRGSVGRARRSPGTPTIVATVDADAWSRSRCCRASSRRRTQLRPRPVAAALGDRHRRRSRLSRLSARPWSGSPCQHRRPERRHVASCWRSVSPRPTDDRAWRPNSSVATPGRPATRTPPWRSATRRSVAARDAFRGRAAAARARRLRGRHRRRAHSLVRSGGDHGTPFVAVGVGLGKSKVAMADAGRPAGRAEPSVGMWPITNRSWPAVSSKNVTMSREAGCSSR